MWLRKRPSMGNSSLPALEPHGGDGMSMEQRGAKEVSGTGVCDKWDLVPVVSS